MKSFVEKLNAAALVCLLGLVGLPAMNAGDEIEVTGIVRNVNHIEIERETNWKFNPQITIELADVSGYLVADSVRIIERQ